VLGSGSVRGIDERRFRPDVATRASTRQSLGIPEDRTVLVFVGRLTRDKGLIELSRAIRELRQELPELHTILVGFEEGNFTQELLAEIGNASDRVSLVGYSDNPERFLTASDFMVQPSYREGFGASVIEAAACGLPTIGTRIVGLIDAIVDGETGLLIPPRETKALKDAIRFLARNPDIRMQMGSVAQHRARKEFATKMLTEALQEHYVHALAHASRA
jgi:glycosyltransferase involved in cell wall biosynthesis